MTKLAYLECPTGIAGDMCLGALVDAGVPLDYLIESLSRLGNAHEYKLWAERVHRNGQQATKVHVDLQPHEDSTRSENQPATSAETTHRFSHHHTHFATEIASANPSAEENTHHHSHRHSHSHSHRHPPDQEETERSPDQHLTFGHHHHEARVRHLPDIEQMILGAKLPARAEAWSLAVFRRLAEAEGAVHGISPEKVHFHEVGATDAIVDIVGTCLGFDWLGIEQIYCSALPTGGGTVWAAHGRLPVPSPAVLKLWELRQIPIYSNGIDRELVTPTGAAIATTLATQFGPPPSMTLLRVGLGAGSISLPLPNILRLWIGERGKASLRESPLWEKQEHQPPQPATAQRPSSADSIALASPASETVAVLETQIDDLNPQAIGYVSEALFDVGALDVFTQAIGMKKSRPGLLLTIVCQPENVPACEAVIFRETTTLGIRRSIQQRRILQREIQQVQTAYGAVRVKVAWDGPDDCRPRQLLNVQPEYEDCAQIARQQNLPWKEVHRLVSQTWYAQQGQ